MYVRREGRDDDAVFGIAEDIFNRLLNHAFRGCIARTHRVGAVAEHQRHALLTNLRQLRKVDRFSVNRCIVDLEVAGVEYHACRSRNRQTDRVRD